jgi:hypothetical protein
MTLELIVESVPRYWYEDQYIGTGAGTSVPLGTGMRGLLSRGKWVFEPVGNEKRDAHCPTGGGEGRSDVFVTDTPKRQTRQVQRS